MLTEVQCKNAICPPGKKRSRFTDSGGLYLEVGANGSKRWFWKFRKGSVESRLALGIYPAVGLSAARKSRDSARLQRSNGEDPVQGRKDQKQKLLSPKGDTFKVVALDWFYLRVPNWSESHSQRTLRNLEKDLIPFLGAKPMVAISPIELLMVVQKVEDRGSLEAAKRVLDTASQVFKHWLPMAPPQYRNICEGLDVCHPPKLKPTMDKITAPATALQTMVSV